MLKVLGIFSFLQFGWADILDIGMVGLLIFFLLRSIRGNSTVMNIVLVLALLVAAQAIASALNMRMMTVLLNALLDVGVLAIIIIFQPEIRHLLNRFAMQTGISRRTGDLFNRLLGIKEEQLGSRSVEELAEAVRAMSAEKTGALIVIQHKSSMDEFMDTGDRFDAEINRRLIMNIFFKHPGPFWHAAPRRHRPFRGHRRRYHRGVGGGRRRAVRPQRRGDGSRVDAGAPAVAGQRDGHR